MISTNPPTLCRSRAQPRFDAGRALADSRERAAGVMARLRIGDGVRRAAYPRARANAAGLIA